MHSNHKGMLTLLRRWSFLLNQFDYLYKVQRPMEPQTGQK